MDARTHPTVLISLSFAPCSFYSSRILLLCFVNPTYIRIASTFQFRNFFLIVRMCPQRFLGCYKYAIKTNPNDDQKLWFNAQLIVSSCSSIRSSIDRSIDLLFDLIELTRSPKGRSRSPLDSSIEHYIERSLRIQGIHIEETASILVRWSLAVFILCCLCWFFVRERTSDRLLIIQKFRYKRMFAVS